MTQAQLEKYVAFRADMGVSSMKQLTHEIKLLDAQIRAIELEQTTLKPKSFMGAVRKLLGQKSKELVPLRMRLAALTKKLGAVQVASYAAEFEAMCSVARVRKIIIDLKKKSLLINTDTLFGRDQRRIWHKVGEFDISAPLYRPSSFAGICWHNKTNPLSNAHAPTVIKGGGYATCFGTLHDPLDKAYAREDYVTIVKLLVRFPECEGQVHSLSAWPAVPANQVPAWYVETFGT